MTGGCQVHEDLYDEGCDVPGCGTSPCANECCGHDWCTTPGVDGCSSTSGSFNGYSGSCKGSYACCSEGDVGGSDGACDSIHVHYGEACSSAHGEAHGCPIVNVPRETWDYDLWSCDDLCGRVGGWCERAAYMSNDHCGSDVHEEYELSCDQGIRDSGLTYPSHTLCWCRVEEDTQDEDEDEGTCATTFSPCGTCGDDHCTVEGCPFRGYECGAPDGECMFNVIDPGHDGYDYFNAGSCRDMCATFGQDCVRAEEYSDNLCGAAFVQSYSCDDDYAAIQGSSTSHTGHTFCTCTSGGSSSGSGSGGGGPATASTSTIIASVAAAACLVLIGGLGILYLKIQRLQRPDAPLDAHVVQGVALEMATVEQTAPPSYVSKGQPPPPGQSFCIDCGAALRGPFCGECGRRQTSALPAEETSEGTYM